MNIILMGMPASGKTTTGKILAKKLNCDFFDTDTIIEFREKQSIKFLFKNFGEDYFRRKEIELINEFIENKIDNTVIATGGGLSVYCDNLSKLKKLGTTVFLNLPIEILIKRNMKSNNRPLLIEDIAANTKKLYNKRISIYKNADVIIDTKTLGKQAIADYIIKNIKNANLHK
ncbi:shikimate kinase [Clostridium peptidivorans]|uniref:shikimate kinase n=1 Tax=Clostridium peptidivorans TaxID=100174 RepID=UPI000BE3E984|nr:shikimate kinase [Clostridium peptidivorans]